MLQAVVVHVIIVSPAAIGQVELSSSKTQVCPGEIVEFTCTVYNGPQLQWRTPFDRAIAFLPSHLPGRVVNRTGVVASLTHVERHPLNILAANMTSTLTFLVWNNTEVFCEGKRLFINVSSKLGVCTVLLLLLWWCICSRPHTPSSPYILIPPHPHPPLSLYVTTIKFYA